MHHVVIDGERATSVRLRKLCCSFLRHCRRRAAAATVAVGARARAIDKGGDVVGDAGGGGGGGGVEKGGAPAVFWPPCGSESRGHFHMDFRGRSRPRRPQLSGDKGRAVEAVKGRGRTKAKTEDRRRWRTRSRLPRPDFSFFFDRRGARIIFPPKKERGKLEESTASASRRAVLRALPSVSHRLSHLSFFSPSRSVEPLVCHTHFDSALLMEDDGRIR